MGLSQKGQPHSGLFSTGEMRHFRACPILHTPNCHFDQVTLPTRFRRHPCCPEARRPHATGRSSQPPSQPLRKVKQLTATRIRVRIKTYTSKREQNALLTPCSHHLSSNMGVLLLVDCSLSTPTLQLLIVGSSRMPGCFLIIGIFG